MGPVKPASFSLNGARTPPGSASSAGVAAKIIEVIHKKVRSVFVRTRGHNLDQQEATKFVM